VIDLHSHLLPGLDDGAESLDEALEIAGTMAADGVRIVVGTPHVREDYPTTAREMTAALAAVREAVAAAGIPIDVRGGGEIALDALDWLRPEERAGFGLGGNPHALLVEYPYLGIPLGMPDRVWNLRSEGIRVVVAHPERNPDVQESPARIEPVVRGGALVQLTAASVEGRLGRDAQETSRALLEAGWAHLIASDAHTPDVRAAGLAGAAATVSEWGGGGEAGAALAWWLVEGLPGSVLEGAPLPPRPPVSVAQRGLRDRLRRRV
jgi:protein-tyrosine phosphatase